MTEKLVYYRDRQELQAEDLNNTGQFARTSLDHVVEDGIYEGKAWTQFVFTKTATAELTVSDGRMYSGGAVYVAETDTIFDMLTHLPTVNKKWAGIVAWGQNIETDTQPRDFLIDAMDGTTEPQAVPMEKLRKANINVVYGVEAAQPEKPLIDNTNVIIGWVLLNSTDIESFELATEYKLPQVGRNATAINSLEAWRTLIGARVDSLASELARIIGKLSGLGEASVLSEIAADVARLKEINELQSGYVSYGADRYLDSSQTETLNVNNLCLVEEGVRFKAIAENLAAVALFNPIEPNVKVSSGLILPTYTEKWVPVVNQFSQSNSISQYTYGTHSAVQKTMARTRIRYGEERTVCTNARWWKSGKYDAATNTFRIGAETWNVLSGNTNTHSFLRLRRFWYDTYEETYWEHITVNHSISGMLVGQTFIQPQTAWVPALGLYFTQKGSTGDVHVLLTEVSDNGTPNINKAIMKATLPVANIVADSTGKTATKVPIQPTLLESGKRYGIVLISAGNHYIGMAPGTAYSQGTFFVSVDGAYQIGSFDKDMMFGLYFAQFPVARREINLQSISLSGGITNIDIMASMAVPESCDLTFEVQIAGVWKPLTDVTSGNTVLYGLPALIPLRAVFTGTTDIQPGIDTTASRLYYSRPSTTFKQISSQIATTATQTFKVIVLLENYYETNHDLTCTIQVGGAGGELNPSSTVDKTLDPPVDARTINHLRVQRTFTFNSSILTAPQSNFRITLDGATTSALDTFHIAERVHLSF